MVTWGLYGTIAGGTTPGGTRVDLYTLRNAAGLEATIMTLGATLTTVKVPDRDGKLDIVTLHDSARKINPLFWNRAESGPPA